MTKGKVISAILAAALLTAGTTGEALAQAQGRSGTQAAPAAPAAPADANASSAPADPSAMSDGEKAAAGCGIAAAGALAATYIAGPSEITLLWGGGMLVPSGSITLALALLGQIGASFCAIGAVSTPTVLWAMDQTGKLFAEAPALLSRQVAETTR